jgi:hypothetical protein
LAFEPVTSAYEELNAANVVTLRKLLEHVPSPIIVEREVHRIVKRRGLLVTSAPHIEGILVEMLRRRSWNLGTLHVNQFTTRTFADILSEAGFKNVFSTDYKEYISLSMLATPPPEHLKVGEPIEGLFHPGWTSGKITDRLRCAHSSGLDSCILIGVK